MRSQALQTRVGRAAALAHTVFRVAVHSPAQAAAWFQEPLFASCLRVRSLAQVPCASCPGSASQTVRKNGCMRADCDYDDDDVDDDDDDNDVDENDDDQDDEGGVDDDEMR